MNKMYLHLALTGLLLFNHTNCIWPWSENEVVKLRRNVKDCSIADLGDRYPNVLCYVFSRFKAQSQIIAAKENLEKVKTETIDQSKILEAEKAVKRLEKKHPECFNQKTGVLEIENVNAIILYGPKGTGKTTIARKITEDKNGKFIELNGSSIINKYRGVGPNAIKDAFDDAVESLNNGYTSVTIFIDEADAFAANTSDDDKKEDLSTTKELWQQISKIKNEPRISCILATNTPNELHPNLLSRFVRANKIEIPNPDKEKRKSLLKLFLEERLGHGALEKISTDKSYFSYKSNEEYILDYLVANTEDKGIRFIENYVHGLITICKAYNNGVITFKLMKAYLDDCKNDEKNVENTQNKGVGAIQNCKSFAYEVGVSTVSHVLGNAIIQATSTPNKNGENKSNASQKTNLNTLTIGPKQ